MTLKEHVLLRIPQNEYAVLPLEAALPRRVREENGSRGFYNGAVGIQGGMHL